MIKDVYCSFIVSKLIDEKGGINTMNNAFYDEAGEFHDVMEMDAHNALFAAHTHSVVRAWLREVYNIFIEVSVSIDLNSEYHYSYSILDNRCAYIRKGITSPEWKYEAAEESAILYVLQKIIS